MLLVQSLRSLQCVEHSVCASHPWVKEELSWPRKNPQWDCQRRVGPRQSKANQEPQNQRNPMTTILSCLNEIIPRHHVTVVADEEMMSMGIQEILEEGRALWTVLASSNAHALENKTLAAKVSLQTRELLSWVWRAQTTRISSLFQEQWWLLCILKFLLTSARRPLDYLSQDLRISGDEDKFVEELENFLKIMGNNDIDGEELQKYLDFRREDEECAISPTPVIKTYTHVTCDDILFILPRKYHCPLTTIVR